MQQPQRLCLRDELFLLAHKPNGVCRVHVPSLSIALAAATLVDLQLAGRILVHSATHLRLRDVTEMPDRIARHAFGYVTDTPERRQLTVAIDGLANDIYDRTGQSLHMDGRVIKQVSGGTLFRRRRERLVHTPEAQDLVGQLRATLYWGTQVGTLTDPQSMALCTLVAMLRMQRFLIEANVSDRTLDLQLRLPVGRLDGEHGPPLRWLLGAAEERIGSLAVAVHR